MRRIGVFIIELLFLLVPLASRASELAFRRFLPDQEVRCMVLDDHSRLWVGTNNGFSIINNSIVRDFVISDLTVGQLSDLAVSQIVPSGKQALVATASSLFLFDIETQSLDEILYDGRKISVDASAFFSDKAYLYSIADQALYAYSYDSTTLEICYQFDRHDRYQFHSISAGIPNHLLLADNNRGLFKYDVYKDTIQHLDDLPDNIIASAVAINSDKSYLWVPGPFGINCYRINGEDLSLISTVSHESGVLSTNETQDIVALSDYAFVVAQGYGMTRVNTKGEVLQRVNGSFTSNLVSIAAQRFSQSFIGGTSYNGLIVAKDHIIKELSSTAISNSTLTSSTVTSYLDTHDGLVWLGTAGNGINCYDQNTHEVMKYPLPSLGTISSMVSYGDGYILCVVNHRDIVLFSKKSGKVEPISVPALEMILSDIDTESQMMVADAGNGSIFVLNVNGANYRFTPGVNSIESFVLGTREHPDPVAGIEVGNHSTFIHSQNAVYVLDNVSLMVRRLYHDDERTVHDISCMEGECVIAALSDALIRIDTGTREVEDITEILNNEKALGISFDANGTLWTITENSFLMSVDLASGKRRYFPEAGYAQYSGFFSYATKENNLFFSRSSGVLAINVDELSEQKKSEVSPRIALERIKFNGEVFQVPLGNTRIELPAKNNFFEFDVLVISDDPLSEVPINLVLYKKDKAIGYQYGSLTNYLISRFEPGTYQIKVSMLTSFGWTDEETILEVHVHNPWFLTWWAALLALILLSSVFMAEYVIMKARRKRSLEKTASQIEHQKNEEKISLMANLAHDLRSPLSLVQNMINSVIDDRNDDVFVSKTLGGTVPQITRMTDMINMILSIQKMDTTSEEVRYEVINLNKWISDRLEYEYKPKCLAKGLKLEFIPEKYLSEIHMDISKIYACFQNLMTNAIKFSEEGTITVSTQIVNNYIRISVADEGCGFDGPAENLFRKFYRQNTAVSGYGLGLAYVKTLVEKLGGVVSAYHNISGVGSTFYFDVPLINVEGSSTAVERERNIEYDSRHDILLVVDDQKDIREYVTSVYKDQFRKILTAPDGLQALQVITEKHPDLIISDLIMPNMDGFELCKQVKSTTEISHIPFVLFSTKEDALSQHISYKLGPDDCIAKPFDVKLLTDIIRFQLRSRRRFKDSLKSKEISRISKDMLISKADEDFISRLDAFIVREDATLESCARHMGMFAKDFESKLEALTGMSVNDYIQMVILND